MSVYGCNGNQVDHPHSKMMILRDNILGFKHLKGEPIHETWLRFKKLLLQRPTHGIPDKMLLGCFYRGLGPENRGVADQHSPGGLT